MQSFWPRNGHIDGMSYGFETWTVCHIRHTGIYEHHCDNECGKPNLVYFWNSSRINGISLADNWYGLACGSRNWPSRWTFSDNVGTWNGTRWHFKCIINVINGIAIKYLRKSRQSFVNTNMSLVHFFIHKSFITLCAFVWVCSFRSRAHLFFHTLILTVRQIVIFVLGIFIVKSALRHFVLIFWI